MKKHTENLTEKAAKQDTSAPSRSVEQSGCIECLKLSICIIYIYIYLCMYIYIYIPIYIYIYIVYIYSYMKSICMAGPERFAPSRRMV